MISIRCILIFILLTKPLFSSKIIYQDCNEPLEPPYHGTIFLDPNIITKFDKSSFEKIEYVGKEERVMFDRRYDDWITVVPFIFIASFSDNLIIEVQVNPEFITVKDAKNIASKYCMSVGQLPTSLRLEVKTMWIHRGMKAFGGGNQNILIHTDWSEMHYEDQGILEETLFHEATHTSLDGLFSEDENWTNAQEKDCNFISTYALENPEREDIAESFLPFFVIKFFPNRIPASMNKTILETIPARIKYFDDKVLDYFPLISE